MTTPLQIRFRNLDSSPAVEAAIRKRAEKLERFDQKIVSCSVTIEVPHKHRHQGNLYHVTVDVHTSGGEIVANRSPAKHHAHEDIYVAIRDAFRAARRQLQDFRQEKRGKIKNHEVPAHGKIMQFYPADGYGTITDSSDREIYFHRNSVVNAAADGLNTGMEVRFVEEAGDKGPQASSVFLIGKHHIVG